jgi:hypothetical protein
MMPDRAAVTKKCTRRDPSAVKSGPRTARLSLAVICLVAGITLAACGSSQTRGPSAAPAPSAAQAPPATILSEPVVPTTFAQVRAAALAVYRSHPAIAKFTAKDVQYTSKTRNKVLDVCHRGGPEKSAHSLESTRVLACAPLIYFFYSYGRSASAPDALAAARRLYWYAVTANRKPFQAGPGLSRLLLSWGVA